MRNKIKIISVVLFISAFVLLTSCQQQKAEWKGTIEEVNGVIVVKNPKEPMYGEDVFGLEEELTIGEAEGPGEYMFSQLRTLAVDEEERFYIADSKESHIKVFDKNGEYLRTVGRKGPGPGEISSPYGIQITQQKELVVNDQKSRRLSFFDLNGKFIKSLNMGRMWAPSLKIDSNGNILITEVILDPASPSFELKKLDPNLNPMETIVRISGLDTRANNPYMPVINWRINKNDNIVYGYPENYELIIYSPEGDILRKITKDYDPVKIPDEERERIKKALPGTKFALPKFYSAFYRITLDDEGRIFVQTWEKIINEEGYYHDVFDLKGGYVAKVPLRIMPLVWKNNKLYTIEEDEEGFQMVKRYKVTWRY